MQLFLDVSQNVVSVSGDIPFIAGYLKNDGKDFYNALIVEVARVYGDDPQRAINALISFLKRDKSSGVCNCQFTIQKDFHAKNTYKYFNIDRKFVVNA